MYRPEVPVVKYSLAWTVDPAGANLRLSWDASWAGVTLENAPGLSPPVQWTPVIGVAGNSATVPLSEQARFYRLRK